MSKFLPFTVYCKALNICSIKISWFNENDILAYLANSFLSQYTVKQYLGVTKFHGLMKMTYWHILILAIMTAHGSR